MKLYVGNCTKQNFRFTYTFKGNTKMYSHEIKYGQQMCYEYESQKIDEIIAQHSAYGLCLYNKMPSKFDGLCYRIDEPIPAKYLLDGLEADEETRQRETFKRSELSMAAIDKRIDNFAEEMGIEKKGGVKLEVVETLPPDVERDAFKQTFTVDKTESIKRGRPRKNA